MLNPILQNRQFLLIYALFWTMLTVIHTMLLHWTQGFAWHVSLLEASIYCITFSIVGLGIWFVVRFSGLESSNLWNALTNHLTAAALLITIWLMTAYSLTAYLLGQHVAVTDIPASDIWWRATLGFVYYLLITLVYYLLMFYENYREKQMREIEMKAMLRESELSMLKAQINPHFIFNSLNSISSLTLTRPVDAHEMIVKLSSFLRYTIGHAETELVTVKKEIETIQLYLEIEKLRFGNKLAVTFLGLENIPLDAKLPNLILQPMIENAIKYGVYESIGISTITVKLSFENNALEIQITNSIESDHTTRKGKGIGLQNVMGRLQLIYEHNDLLKIISEKEYFQVHMTIPQFETIQVNQQPI